MNSNLHFRWFSSRWLVLHISTMFAMVTFPRVPITQNGSFCAAIFYAIAVVGKIFWAANWWNDVTQISWKLEHENLTIRNLASPFTFWYFLPAHLLFWALIKILTTLASFCCIPLLLATKSSTYPTSRIIRMKHFWNRLDNLF